MIDAQTAWEAFARRDRTFDGRFVIGVLTTGIYCRPICPAPSPKKSNIRYFPTAAAAAEAGLRPCLRCRPEAAPGTPAWAGTSVTVRRALRLIQEGALDDGSVDEVAARLGVGTRHLHRLFVQHVGASPIVVAQTRRLHFAKRLIDDTELPMTDIALASGFGSLRRFNAAFRHTYKRAPRELRRDHRATTSAPSNGLNLRLAYRPPYDWKSLHAFLAARALPGVERVTDQIYARSIRVNDASGWLEIRRAKGTDALELSVHGLEPPALFNVVSRVRQMFDLAADPADVRAVLRHDALLAPLLRARPGLRVPGAWDPFEIAVRAVLGQQISVAAARTFAARLVSRYGSAISAGEGLTHLFPEPAQLANADLSVIGLTRSRAATIKALAVAVRDGQIRFDASSPVDEVRAALLNIAGIGSWTAEYIAMRGLGDPDAFPAEDLVLRRMAGRDKALTAAVLRKRSETWRPWRAYVVTHLWRAASIQDS